ncbi:hypothetical protein WN943_006422 [Citrus x changshan-huyou]
MHANLRPHVTKTLSPNTYVPNPNPLRHPHSLLVEPTLILTTLDPHKRTAVTIPINNHEIVSNPPSGSSGKEADNLEQQLYPNHLTDPLDEKDDGAINTMVFYDGDPQLAFSNEDEDIMSDDENIVVNETPGVHGGATLGLSM